MIGRIVRFFGDAEQAKRRRWLLAATLLAVFVADFFVPREHVDFFWDAISGWAALFGDEDGQQRGGEQPAPPLGLLGIPEEADDPSDHGTTPHARVRK